MQKESIRQKFSRKHGYYLRLNFEAKNNEWMSQDGRHDMVDITPHIYPKVLDQCRRTSEGRFYVKHTKDIDGRVVIHKQSIEMINEATVHGLEK